MKTLGCQSFLRWKSFLVVGIVILIGLLACDIGIHVSQNHKERSSLDSTVVDRRKRSPNAQPSMSLEVQSTTSSTGEIHNETPVPRGAVFTIWGRADCPASSALVYKGIIGSGHAGHKGGGAEYLCLTDEPEWMGAFGAINKWSIMYGVEYKDNVLGMAVNQNAMCAVCQSRRANKVMIPGRISCPVGWSKEYHGYLMSSEYREEAGNNFICVTLNPEPDRSGFQGDGGGTLHNVYSSCGSLPCPKYREAGVITCVVCTR